MSEERFPALYRIKHSRGWVHFGWRTAVDHIAFGSTGFGACISAVENGLHPKFKDQAQANRDFTLYEWHGTQPDGFELGRCNEHRISDEFGLLEYLKARLAGFRQAGGHSVPVQNVLPIENLIFEDVATSESLAELWIESINSSAADVFPIQSGMIFNLGEWAGGVCGIKKGVDCECVCNSVTIDVDHVYVNATPLSVMLEMHDSREAKSRKIVPEVAERVKLQVEDMKRRATKSQNLSSERQISLTDDE